LNKYVIAWLIN